MLTSNRTSLFKQIQRLVMPKLLLVILVFVLAISLAFFYTGEAQIARQHQAFNNQLMNNLDTNIKNLVDTTEGLSQNDLLINGLIDFQMRDEYLPLFFQSLKMGKSQQSASALFDFSGDVVQSKNWDNQQINQLAPNWRTIVLEQGNTYIDVSQAGVLVIAPIELAGVPEGALGVYVKELAIFANFTTNDVTQYIVDANNNVVFSNNKQNSFTTYQGLKDAIGYAYVYSSPWKSFQIVSVQSFKSSYAKSMWLLPFLIVAVFGSLITSLLGVHLAAKKASITLRSMYHSLQKSTQNTHQEQSIPADEAFELSRIRQSFYDLLNQLLSLSLSNDKITNVINSLNELLVVVDHNGNVMLSNTTSDGYFARSELSQKDIINLGLACLAKNTDLHFSTKADSNGNELTINWTVLPFVDADGKHIGAILNGEDVSLTLSLKNDINLRNQAMEVSPAAISICDVSLPGSPLIYVNQAFCSITGYQQDEVLGKNCNFLQGESTQASAIQTIRNALMAKAACSVVLNNYKKDGTAFINSLALKPVLEPDGSVRYYVGVQQDITTEKQTEKYLAQAKDNAEDMAKAQARFFAGINHELRTPINGINGMIKALLNSPLNEQQSKQAALANQSANNLLLLVNDVLDYSKAESGQLSIDSQDFNLKTLCENLAESYDMQCQHKHLHFEWRDKPTTDVFVKGDKLRLQQVIDNLFSNALKFTESGSIRIQLTLSDIDTQNTQNKAQQQKLSISVKDTGIGIPDDQISKIFENFGQVQSSTRKITSGTGLGLNISKQLIKLMGGKLELNSECGHGSDFSFYIIVEPSQAIQSAEPNQAKQKVHVPLDGPAPVVLVVEDNEINQQVVLANLPETKNIVAANGLVALEILNKAKIKFDVILMDCQMPELDGWDTTRLIRNGQAGEKYEEIPVIALTAYTALKDQQECKQAGMNDYVSKPFDPQQLLDKVAYWTAISRQQKSQERATSILLMTKSSPNTQR